MGEDLRVRKTKSAINSAFLKLLSRKKLKDISVKEISELAQCNRNTFYLHYADKYDLLDKLCGENLEEMERVLFATYEKTYRSGSDWYFDIANIILEVAEQNSEFYELALGRGRYPAFADMYREAIVKFISFGLSNGETDGYKNLEVEFSASGMVGILKYWLSHREEYSREEVVREMHSFIVKLGDIIF